MLFFSQELIDGISSGLWLRWYFKIEWSVFESGLRYFTRDKNCADGFLCGEVETLLTMTNTPEVLETDL